MAIIKFTDLPAGAALTGAEILAMVQGGVSYQVTAQEIADLAGGTSFGDNWNWVTSPIEVSFLYQNGIDSWAGADDDGSNGNAFIASYGPLGAASLIGGSSGASISVNDSLNAAIVNADNFLVNVDRMTVTAGTSILDMETGTYTLTGDIMNIGSSAEMTLVANDVATLRSLNDAVSLDADAEITMDLGGALEINGDPGTTTFILTSNGPGLPPTWESRGSGNSLLGTSTIRSTNQAFPGGAQAAVSWSSATRNDLGAWSAGFPTRFTAQSTGWHSMSAIVKFDTAGSPGRMIAFWRKNGNSDIPEAIVDMPAVNAGVGEKTYAAPSGEVYMTAGEYLEVMVFNAGARDLLPTYSIANFVQLRS